MGQFFTTRYVPQRMANRIWVAGLMATILLTGCGALEGAQPPLAAEVRQLDCQYDCIPNLFLSATVDEVEIRSITVNRGNCRVFANGLPARVAFGRHYSASLGCSPIEAEVVTDKGTFKFEFDPGE